MSDLKPCPFCGSSDVGRVQRDPVPLRWLGVACNSCGAQSRLSAHQDRADAAWNRRALVPAKRYSETTPPSSFEKNELAQHFFFLDTLRCDLPPSQRDLSEALRRARGLTELAAQDVAVMWTASRSASDPEARAELALLTAGAANADPA